MEGDKLEDKESSVDTKHGYEQQGRDDKEEYSRVPIAGENDSDYDIFEDLHDGTYSQESDEREKGNVNKTATNYVAYAIALNIPGKVAVRTRTKTFILYNRYDSPYLAIEVEEPAPTRTLASPPTTRWTSQLMRYQAHQLKMRYKRKSQLRGKLMRQIRQQTIHLRKRDQGSELKASTLATGLGKGWRRSNHLATVVRDDRPVPTVDDYRKDANLKERPSAQLTHVLTPMPKKETKGYVNKGCHTKSMRRKTRHINVRINGTPRNSQVATNPTSQTNLILPRTLREYQLNPLLYSTRPEWDLCSPIEYYEWTEGWDWDQEYGHRPTQEMANNDWTQAPDMSAYPTLSVAQYMNQTTRDIAVTKESGEINKRRQENEPTHHRNRPRPNQWSPSWTRTFSPIIIAGSPDLLPSDADPPSLQNEQEEQDIESDKDIELYYKAYNKYRPEMDESNAESRERSNLIYQEHQRLKKEKAKKVKESQKIGFHTPEPQS